MSNKNAVQFSMCFFIDSDIKRVGTLAEYRGISKVLTNDGRKNLLFKFDYGTYALLPKSKYSDGLKLKIGQEYRVKFV